VIKNEKILSIFGTVGLIVTTASSVVVCENDLSNAVALDTVIKNTNLCGLRFHIGDNLIKTALQEKNPNSNLRIDKINVINIIVEKERDFGNLIYKKATITSNDNSYYTGSVDIKFTLRKA
jgi:hypothetical protein